MAAGHRGLDNLIAIVDRNRLQQGARTEDTNALDPLDAKFAAFGWAVREVDGQRHRRSCSRRSTRCRSSRAARAA